MAYRPDPGGNFESDTHRRVLAYLPNPDEEPDDDYVVEYLGKDIHHELNSVEELDAVLADLDRDGWATRIKDGWKKTKAGLDELQAEPTAVQPETRQPAALIQDDMSVPIIGLQRARLSNYGRKLLEDWKPEIPLLDPEVPLLGDIAELGELREKFADMPLMAGGASFSDYVENKVLDHLFGDSFTAPTASLGLWTSALTDASTGSTAGELTYTTYARQGSLNTAGATSAAAAGAKTNDAAITFPVVTAGGGTVTFWGTFDATTAGNMLMWGTATSTVISTTQTPPTIAIGQLNATLD